MSQRRTHLIMIAALAFLGTALFSILWGIHSALDVNTNMVAYDCRIAEISPDIAPAIKEECRKRQKEAQ